MHAPFQCLVRHSIPQTVARCPRACEATQNSDTLAGVLLNMRESWLQAGTACSLQQTLKAPLLQGPRWTVASSLELIPRVRTRAVLPWSSVLQTSLLVDSRGSRTSRSNGRVCRYVSVRQSPSICGSRNPKTGPSDYLLLKHCCFFIRVFDSALCSHLVLSESDGDGFFLTIMMRVF